MTWAVWSHALIGVVGATWAALIGLKLLREAMYHAEVDRLTVAGDQARRDARMLQALVDRGHVDMARVYVEAVIRRVRGEDWPELLQSFLRWRHALRRRCAIQRDINEARGWSDADIRRAAGLQRPRGGVQ